MKRFLFISALSLFFIYSYSQNITDGDLNNWTLHSFTGGTYYEPINGWLMTMNKLADLPAVVGGPGPVTTERTTDTYQGTYAAKLISKEFIVGLSHLFIPGAVGTFTVDLVAQIARVGRPYTYSEKPRRFKGYYKYAPVNGDSCLFLVLLTKYNTSSHKRDTIAISRNTVNVNVDSYTPFDYEIAYRDTITTPDSITIFVTSSGFLNFANLQACHGQLNSTMYVDELSFSMVNGIDMPVNPQVKVSLFPNPTFSKITICTKKFLDKCRLEIFDLKGSLVKIFQYEGSSATADVSAFPSGKYYYRLIDHNMLLNSGSFIIGIR